MRISDWSSDVCPSDLFGAVGVSLFGDYVRAKLKGDLGNLPRIPAGRLGARADGQWGPLSGDVEYYHIFEQDRIAAFETRRSEEHTSELQSLMRISYAVFCLKKKKHT